MSISFDVSYFLEAMKLAFVVQCLTAEADTFLATWTGACALHFWSFGWQHKLGALW
jgi:hypothetical protein